MNQWKRVEGVSMEGAMPVYYTTKWVDKHGKEKPEVPTSLELQEVEIRKVSHSVDGGERYHILFKQDRLKVSVSSRDLTTLVVGGNGNLDEFIRTTVHLSYNANTKRFTTSRLNGEEDKPTASERAEDAKGTDRDYEPQSFGFPDPRSVLFRVLFVPDADGTRTARSMGQQMLKHEVPNLGKTLSQTPERFTEQPDDFERAIGRWAELYVKKQLEDRENVDPSLAFRDQNDAACVGIGCDFLLMKGNDVVEEIEVKGSHSNMECLLKLSSAQWSRALDRYQKGEGEKYCLYCVLGAGTDQAEVRVIRNPVQMILDGRISVNYVAIVVK